MTANIVTFKLKAKVGIITVGRYSYFAILFFVLLLVAGCARFDWTKWPLYDEIFVEQEQGLESPARRPPPYNPQPVNK